VFTVRVAYGGPVVVDDVVPTSRSKRRGESKIKRVMYADNGEGEASYET